MTKRVWERELKRHLTGLSYSEKKKVLEYYNEIYGDKAEAGLSEEEVIRGFGSPQEVAKKIMEESGLEYREPKAETKNHPSFVLGMVLFTLLIGLPLMVVAISLLGGAFSVLTSGLSAGVACAVFVLVSPFFYLANGMGGMAILGYVGLGIAGIGVGILLTIGGWYALKYTAIGSWKFFKNIYAWRK